MQSLSGYLAHCALRLHRWWKLSRSPLWIGTWLKLDGRGLSHYIAWRGQTLAQEIRSAELKRRQTVSAPRASIFTLDLLLRVLEPHHPAIAAVTTGTGSSSYFERANALRTHLMALRRACRRPPSSCFSSRRDALCPRLGWASSFQCRSVCQSCQRTCPYARSCPFCLRHLSRPMMGLCTRYKP